LAGNEGNVSLYSFDELIGDSACRKARVVSFEYRVITFQRSGNRLKKVAKHNLPFAVGLPAGTRLRTRTEKGPGRLPGTICLPVPHQPSLPQEG
jgi:hypothetical protein